MRGRRSSPRQPSPSPRQNTAVASPPAKSNRIFLIAALCTAAAVFAVYWPTLEYQFILDDHRFTADPRIQFPDHVWDYFSSFVWAQFTGGPPSFYRPLFLLWMRVNFMLSGLSPWGWHLGSIAKHVLVTVLLGALVYRLLRNRTAAVLAAALFALHPAQAESVAWVTVPDPLLSAGILGALLFYFLYVESLAAADPGDAVKPHKAKNRRPPVPPGLWMLASTGAYFLALLAKESAIIFPAVIFPLALLQASEERSSKNKDSTFRNSLLFALRRTSPFLAVTAVYLLLRLNALSGTLSATTQHLPAKVVWLSAPGILWFYVKAMLWPTHSYAFADPVLESRFSFSGVVLPALALACVIAILLAAIAWTRAKARREWPPEQAIRMDYAVIPGCLLLVLPLLLCVNLNALNPGDFLHGRYTYLPLAGLMILLATASTLAGRLRLPLLCAAGLIALTFATLTISQQKQWKDDLTVFTIAHQLAPRNAPVAKNLADARVRAALELDDQGRCSEALPVFEQVARDYPDDWYAWGAMGDCFLQLNDLPQAETALHRAADLSHDSRTIQQWQELRAHMGLPTAAPSQ